MAKKAEARESDLAGAVDYVLTFQEVRTSSRRRGSTRPSWRTASATTLARGASTRAPAG
ncbi:MAG: hypothetical protein ACLVL7_12080 [Anaerotruncus massiliensis (ex Togo et al. 2019)]